MAEPSGDKTVVNLWRTGDENAARELFDRYAERLMELARKRISQRLGSRVDPEDIVQSVFRTFFHRARQGQFEIEGAEDVCKLLTRITVHKTLRHIVFHTRDKRDARQEAGSGDNAQELLLTVLAADPGPAEVTALLDQMEHFLAQLRPEDRKILEMRMEGYNNVEISKNLGISDRTIRRLMERVRGLAEQE